MTPSHDTTGLRLAHFSDVHVTSDVLGWRRRDWLSKRLPGYINFRWLGRKHRFRTADVVLAALANDLHRRRPDHVVFSGDATALGFEAEMARAASILGLPSDERLPGIAVPGNHDYYTHRSAAEGHFERHFAPWLAGERVDASPYPFAQRVGGYWLVAVNSCVPNRWTWDASGRVGREQLRRIESLLARLDPGPRILVTHYPVALACGRPERRSHGLRDLADVARVAADGGVCLWLHGHRHGAYHHVEPRSARFPVVCAGSATQHGLWSYGEYTVVGHVLQGRRRVYDPSANDFADGDAFEIRLPRG